MMSGQPVGHRIQSLDILRGIALLGMFVVHFHEHTTEPGGLDNLVRTAVWRLVESKSHGTFALLFGAGFAIMLRRAEAAGRPFVPIHLRRLAVLAVFGFAAHLLFGFNVLLGYALWGVPLLLMRRWPTRALVATAVLCTISSPVYHLVNEQRLLRAGGVGAARAADDARAAKRSAVNAALEAAERQPEYRVLLAARRSHMAWFHRQPFFFLPGATLALFIVGLLLVRHRVFEEPLAHRGVLAGLAAFGLVSWLVGNWMIPGLALLLRDQWLTFTYVSGALALLAWRPAIAKPRR